MHQVIWQLCSQCANMDQYYKEPNTEVLAQFLDLEGSNAVLPFSGCGGPQTLVNWQGSIPHHLCSGVLKYYSTVIL